MEALPFRLLGGAALRAVETALTRAAAAWAGEWGIAPSALHLSVARAWEASPGKAPATFGQYAQANGRGMWIASGPDVVAEIQKCLFAADGAHAPPPAGPASLAPAAAAQACDALIDALCRAALVVHQDVAREVDRDVPARTWRRGSGAALVELTLGRQRCRFLLDGEAVQALQAPPAALAPLAAVDHGAALAAVPVALQVTAGAARVSLGNLMSLAVGDVVRLDTAIDAPVALATLAGEPLFHAYLGRSGDSVAVELVHSQSSSFGAVK